MAETLGNSRYVSLVMVLKPPISNDYVSLVTAMPKVICLTGAAYSQRIANLV